jgi:peroxiredoxin
LAATSSFPRRIETELARGNVFQMRRREALAVLGLTALTVGFGAIAVARASAPSAYDLGSLRDHSGKKTSLRRVAGGGVIVAVVMKGTWCSVCMGQLRRLASLRARLSRLGAKVVGISTDSVERCKQAASDAAVPFPILSDAERRVVEALNLWNAEWDHPIPAVAVFDRCGTERGRLVGRTPDQRPEQALLELLEAIAKQPGRCGVANA